MRTSHLQRLFLMSQVFHFTFFKKPAHVWSQFLCYASWNKVFQKPYIQMSTTCLMAIRSTKLLVNDLTNDWLMTDSSWLFLHCAVHTIIVPPAIISPHTKYFSKLLHSVVNYSNSNIIHLANHHTNAYL